MWLTGRSGARPRRNSGEVLVSHAAAMKPKEGGRISARFAGLSIFSILLIVLLASTVVVSIVVGLIGYVNGAASLTDAAASRLVEVRDARADRIDDLFGSIDTAVALAASGAGTKAALR